MRTGSHKQYRRLNLIHSSLIFLFVLFPIPQIACCISRFGYKSLVLMLIELVVWSNFFCVFLALFVDSARSRIINRWFNFTLRIRSTSNASRCWQFDSFCLRKVHTAQAFGAHRFNFFTFFHSCEIFSTIFQLFPLFFNFFPSTFDCSCNAFPSKATTIALIHKFIDRSASRGGKTRKIPKFQLRYEKTLSEKSPRTRSSPM